MLARISVRIGCTASIEPAKRSAQTTPPSARVRELDRHRELRVRDLHRAGEAVAHAEQPADLAHVDIRGAQAERRAARRHEQPAQSRQLGDQLVGQRVGDGRPGPRVPDQPERQHGDRGPRGRFGRPARRAAGSARATGCTSRSALTLATKRKPWRWIVLMKRWALPSSPSACRADFTRLATAASETMRPSQTFSRISSLETRRSRFSTSSASSAKTCGSTGRGSPFCAQLDPGRVELEGLEPVEHGAGSCARGRAPTNLHEFSRRPASSARRTAYKGPSPAAESVRRRQSARRSP